MNRKKTSRKTEEKRIKENMTTMIINEIIKECNLPYNFKSDRTGSEYYDQVIGFFRYFTAYDYNDGNRIEKELKTKSSCFWPVTVPEWNDSFIPERYHVYLPYSGILHYCEFDGKVCLMEFIKI